MTTPNNSTLSQSDLQLVVTRIISAPAALVYQAWTDPVHLSQWFSPQTVECRDVSADFTVGGAFRIHMASEKGDHIAIGTYLQIIPRQLLQFTWQWENYAMPDSVVTVAFEDLGQTTRLTLTHEGLPDAEDVADHNRGWTSMLEKFAGWLVLNSHLYNDKTAGLEFVITREYAAPRDLVWRACTEPNHLAQWWGPKGFSAPVCEWDARPGGKIYVIMRGPDGVEYPMGGEVREVIAPELMVSMTGALDAEGKYLFQFFHTMTLLESNGKTKLMMHSRVINATAGAGRHIGGFEIGMTLSLEKLGEHLALRTEPLVVERVLQAPAALVWQAFSTAEDWSRWCFDLKAFQPEEGFEFEFTAGKGDVTYLHQCRVTEVIPGKRLAFTWRYAGHAGDSLVTIDLLAEGPATRVRLVHTGLETFTMFARDNFTAGWTKLIGTCLKEDVEPAAAAREIVITREIAAPRELVWAALTDPAQVIHWWGPRGFTTTIEQMDVRPGGVWKHVMRGPDGTNYPNESVFQEVVAPARLVFALGGHREGGPGINFVSTWTLDPVAPGKTKVTIRMVFPNPDARDLVVREFGAIEGGRQTLERLGEHLAALATT